MDNLPDFEPTPMEAPHKPRKPRPKPTKRRKVAKKKAVVKTRKKRVAKSLTAETSSVATIISVHAQIEYLLSKLSPSEREAMLGTLK